MRRRANKWFLIFILALAAAGFFVFSSAALGLHSRDGASFILVVGKQLLVLALGLAGMLLAARIPYRFWRQYSLPIFLLTLVLTAAVFIPSLGFKFGGAVRWLHLGPISLQPSEFLKFGLVLYLAAWLAKNRREVESWQAGLLPFLIITGLAGGLILAQPDLGTFLIIFSAAFMMFFVAGARWSHIAFIVLASLILVASMAYFKPYVRERLLTLWDPSRDMQGSAYQINQSLIALGSGGLFGRGFGQSVQKFQFLPEPIGDSIFSVAGEEFGFVGTTTLVLLYIIFSIWGFRLSARVTDTFGRFLGIGLVSLITVGAFFNIASMVGLAPVVGVPLSLFSHGGTALLVTLFEIGILLNISKYA